MMDYHNYMESLT